MDLHGKRALVMGLGVHGGGLGVAQFLVSQGAAVTITDLRGREQLQSSLDALAGLPIEYVLGEHRDEDFRQADLVIRNPGVPRESRYLQIARANGAQIEMEMTLFFRLCPGPILGITGTKGKTTTTLLTAAILREQFPDTVVAGNLRISALQTLPQITPTTPVVLELSSWQLEGLGEAQLSPRYACVTNLSPDHLDRYGSMAAYADAKQQIFLHQGVDGLAVRNWEDKTVAQMAPQALSQAIWFSSKPNQAAQWPHAVTLVGWQDDRLIWRTANGDQEIVQAADVRLAGEHNRANIAAAVALTKAFGVENAHIRQAIRTFSGVEHRQELVRELAGVRYINDTTATAPEAAIAALRSYNQPIVLIAGGANKNLPFGDLAREIVLRAKALVLLAGSATPELQRELQTALAALREQISAETYATLQSQAATTYDAFAPAVHAARDLALAGDVVLLSPGCASFGMFRNEFQRGEQFREIVQHL